MLRFANPEFLLLIPPTALFAWWWARCRRPALRYSDTRLFAGLPRGRAKWANWGGAALRGLALSAVALAAAGPRTPDLRTRLPAEGIAIMLVLDISGSMAAPDYATSPGGPPVSRLDAAKQVLRLFVAGGDAVDGTHFDGRPRDRIGLVAFAAVPETEVPLTHNHSVLLTVLDAQQAKAGIDAGTNVGDALAEGLIRLDAAGPRRKVLVLLSDGEHNIHRDNPDAPLKPRQAAQLAANLGVPVYAIDCGGEPKPDATPEELKQRADGRQVLEAVAALTGGRSFTAITADELLSVYREIDALEKQPDETFRYRRYHEYYPWCAVAAVGMLGTAYLLERTLWRRVPG
jgi:Ca-activated chloride channel family protein